ncbi:MAG: YlbF family regulator [Lysinibacillus sp.]
MLMTSEWAFILDEADMLSAMILSSEQARNLRIAYQAVYGDAELAAQVRAFSRLKEHYEDVQRFGKYHPDYHTIMKKIREQKRALDLNEKVAQLKVAENDYQDLLDEISLIIGKSVSEAVKVPVSNPFFSTGGGGCSTGGCGSGGSCSCSA